MRAVVSSQLLENVADVAFHFIVSSRTDNWAAISLFAFPSAISFKVSSSRVDNSFSSGMHALLEGYDRDWHDAGNRRQGLYTNLPPRQRRRAPGYLETSRSATTAPGSV